MASSYLPGTLGMVVLLGLLIRKRITFRRRGLTRVRALVVLGSGGHTSEMLRLLQQLVLRKGGVYHEVRFVVADTDASSRKSAEGVLSECAHMEHPPHVEFVTIPRSREVGQPYLTSVLTTARAAWRALHIVHSADPHILLCNGPGTCLPVCVAAILRRALVGGTPTIVYIESIARVHTLSLTGKLIMMLHLADAFLVQWPQLAARYPRACFIGRLC